MTTDLVSRLEEGLSDRYRILREVGRGGMATVVLAEDLKHDRQVAIKVLDPDVVGTIAAERFHREIRVAARLQHPHILPLFDSGEAGGLFYYVMPYVEGESLRDRLDREGTLEASEAVRIAREVAAGLAHAHGRGLVHRDIKPENVLLSDGHAVVADFGIAHVLEEAQQERLTRTGLSIGTPAYMSPEQWDGESPDRRSDLYSLACVVYEMMAGEPPYSGSTPAAILASQATDPVPSLQGQQAGVPQEVESAVSRALSKDPSHRFSSVEEFSDALSGAPVEGRPSAAWSAWAPLRWARHRRLATAVVAGVAVLGAAAVVVLPGGEPALKSDRVAVGLLENRTGDPSLDDLGRMAADWITEGLQRTGVVNVVPSPTALQASNYVRRQMEAGEVRDPVAELARETGSRLVVSGAYYLEQGDVRVQMQVSDARSGELLGALEPVEGARESPGALVEELREKVMGLLAVSVDERLATAATSRSDPPTFEAYSEFNRGLQAYIDNDYDRAVTHLLRAYERDATFTLALLYAAVNHMNLQNYAAADSLVRMVTGSDPDLTDYHSYWVEYLRARLDESNEEAYRAIRRAADLAPGSKAVYNAARMANVTNRPAEAVRLIRTLDPDRGPMRGWFPYWRVLTEGLHRLGRHEEELEAARRARRAHPERREGLVLEGDALAALGRVRDVESLVNEASAATGSEPNTGDLLRMLAVEFQAHGLDEAAETFFQRALEWLDARPAHETGTVAHRVSRAEVLHAAGRWQEARSVLDSLAREFPNREVYRQWAGILAAATGDREDALAVSRSIAARDRKYSFGRPTLQRARIAAHLGDAAEATRLLSRALEEGLEYPRHLDANFRVLQDHPPMRRLLAPRG